MTEPPGAAMMRMITGAWVSQAVYIAAQLGVADLIAAEGPRTAGDLAARVDADPDALYRVLRALAGIGVLTEGNDGAFALTPLAECLPSDGPHSLRAFSIMMGEQWVWRSWGEALHSVRTGGPAFDHVYGMGVFDYYSEHPEAGRVGAAGLSARSGGENAAILAAYDFAAVDSVTTAACSAPGPRTTCGCSVSTTSPVNPPMIRCTPSPRYRHGPVRDTLALLLVNRGRAPQPPWIGPEGETVGRHVTALAPGSPCLS